MNVQYIFIHSLYSCYNTVSSIRNYSTKESNTDYTSIIIPPFHQTYYYYLSFFKEKEINNKNKAC